jgi:rSAM/selenodomain-associated transferase 1
MRRHLVVMARAPRWGVGKRRLARGAGETAAWRFQRFVSGAVLRRLAADRRWTTWLAVTPDRAASRRRFGPSLPAAVRVVAQGRGVLGARMGRQLRRPPPGSVVVVGLDIPALGPVQVAEAFRALGRRRWVLGPAADGGYWLIGSRRRPVLRLPFGGVRWSSRHALADTLARLDSPAELLEELEDVDEATDLAGLPPGVLLASTVVRRGRSRASPPPRRRGLRGVPASSAAPLCSPGSRGSRP